MSSKFLADVESYIYNYYKNNDNDNNVYHDLAHINYVVKRVEEIGSKMNILDDEMEILKIAAWFHDIGHLETWEGHEEKSVLHLNKYLSDKNYPKEKADKIIGCINATKIPHNPKNNLEEIICDADILHVGTKDFFDRSDLLKLEIEKRKDISISELNWLKMNVDFLNTTKFHTKYAKSKYDERKNVNLIKLQKRLKKKEEKKSQSKVKDEKLAFEKEKLLKKTADSNKPDRGIETMFRNVIRTHVSFSSMADSKANIMISVNTLLLGAVFTILARKLDSNPHLILPTVILTLVSLITLIMAVKVTRPSISSGMFTKEDIEKKNTNLLFFGNFYKMDLKDFTWGMNEMMLDKDFLYDSFIKDFYYLGQVLGRKYKLLRLCYTFFMYGISLSALLFAIYVWLNPNPTNIGSIIE